MLRFPLFSQHRFLCHLKNRQSCSWKLKTTEASYLYQFHIITDISSDVRRLSRQWPSSYCTGFINEWKLSWEIGIVHGDWLSGSWGDLGKLKLSTLLFCKSFLLCCLAAVLGAVPAFTPCTVIVIFAWAAGGHCLLLPRNTVAWTQHRHDQHGTILRTSLMPR